MCVCLFVVAAVVPNVVCVQTDYPNAPMEHACPLLPCGDFGPNGAQLAWLEQDLAQVCLSVCVLF